MKKKIVVAVIAAFVVLLLLNKNILPDLILRYFAWCLFAIFFPLFVWAIQQGDGTKKI